MIFQEQCVPITAISVGLSQMLTRRDPLTFLLAYLALLPLFAGLYQIITPDGFYAPYAQREPLVQIDRSRMIDDLTTAIMRNVKENESSKFESTECRFTRIGYRDDNVINRVPIFAELTCTNTTSGGYQFDQIMRADVLVSATPTKVWIRGNPLFFHPVEHLLKRELPDADKIYQSKMFGILFENLVSGLNSGGDLFFLDHLHILLTLDEEAHFTNYVHGVGGDPLAISGSFWRMLYFGAVVQTTLGLGDIVPVTAAARFLVASQAVAGIVLAGLFLNAVAYRASGRSRD